MKKKRVRRRKLRKHEKLKYTGCDTSGFFLKMISVGCSPNLSQFLI